MKRPLYPIVAVATVSFLYCGDLLGGSDISLDRYTKKSPLPLSEQNDLLSVLIDVKFPSSITTVGGAIEYLLQQSGYVHDNQDRDEVRKLWKMPLPRVHRNIGPVQLRVALETIAGPPWSAIENPLRRTVTFELKPRFALNLDSSSNWIRTEDGPISTARKGEETDSTNERSNVQNQWILDPSLTLFGNIDSWTKSAGWHLAWKSRHDYEITYESRVAGTMKEAVTRILEFYQSAPVPLMAKFYDGNSVLVVESVRARN